MIVRPGLVPRIVWGSVPAILLTLGCSGKVAEPVATTAVAPEADPADTAESTARKIGEGRPEALAALRDRIVGEGETTARPLDDAAFAEIATILREAGPAAPKFGPTGRASLAALSGALLDRLAVEPAPRAWSEALGPIRERIERAIADPEPAVRMAALGSIARVWNWMPGRTSMPVEESAVDAWKESFHAPVAAALEDPAPQVRATAVACLAQLPIDALAAPAAVRVADADPQVRTQALIGFARRPAVLGEDEILPRLHDANPSIVLLAKTILSQRGLTEAQIDLGRQVVHPNAEVRKAVLTQLDGRDDIDPIVWQIRLSHDPEESVRAEALKALASRKSDDMLRRTTEMAVGDPSGPIRVQARKLLPPEAAALLAPPDDGVAAGIPPLPTGR